METRPILCPTDFSEHSELALRYASLVAHASSAPLTIAYVEANPVPYGAGLGGYVPTPKDVDEARTALQVLRPPVEGVKYERVFLFGDPATEIVKYALEHDAALIVMGTHGRGGLSRLLMGSVAQAVQHRAPCPVMTVTKSRQKGPAAVRLSSAVEPVS